MLVSSSFHQYRTAPLPGKRPDKNSPRAKGRAPVLGLRSEGAQRPSDEGEGRGLERPAASGESIARAGEAQFSDRRGTGGAGAVHRRARRGGRSERGSSTRGT